MQSKTATPIRNAGQDAYAMLLGARITLPPVAALSVATKSGVGIANASVGSPRPRPRLRRDWAHPPPTSAPGLGSPPHPHLHRDRRQDANEAAAVRAYLSRARELSAASGDASFLGAIAAVYI
jgi:hypothetical protein